jgi:hypothetical protein
MAALLVPDIKAFGVNAQQPLHPDHQIGLGRFHDQMKMIAHQTVGVNLPPCLAAGLGQGNQEQPKVPRTAKDLLTAIPSIHHMINRSRKFTAHLAWHEAESDRKSAAVNQFK